VTLAVELYEFIQGDNVYTYTSASTSVFYNFKTYTPKQISREKITQTTDPLREPISISFPRSDAFAKNFIAYAADDFTSITIFRGQLNGSIWAATYRGRIVEAVSDGNTIKLSCESIYTSIQKNGLQARYEYTCRHLLYSTQCGANKNSFSNTGTVGSKSNTTITVAAASSRTNGYFSGGILEDQNGNTRYILSHTGSTLVISKPWPQLSIGDAVTIYAGCNRARSTCVNKFNNVINFGGFPWIPNKNPFEVGIT
jgi:uncharacterized phage protein (TIGR02218 family)